MRDALAVFLAFGGNYGVDYVLPLKVDNKLAIVPGTDRRITNGTRAGARFTVTLNHAVHGRSMGRPDYASTGFQ
jgi:hypothetical protein